MYSPCYPVQRSACVPRGSDLVTMRRPLIVGDSTIDYRPTSRPGMLVSNRDKKVRYKLINFNTPVQPHVARCSPF